MLNRWHIVALGAVDAQRLGDRVDLLSAEDMWDIDDALVTVLGLT